MSPYFNLFGRDFIAATLGWSAEERGHYIVLLIAQWELDGLSDDVKRLELISPGVSKCWKTIEPKFPISRDKKRRNLRLEHERQLAIERSERARQSASARWSGKTHAQAIEGAAAAKSGGDECDRICDGISDGICDDGAAKTKSYSPPPPPPPPGDLEGVWQAWQTLVGAWNAAWGEKRQWRSTEPPREAIDRLGEPGWLDDALRAIPEIKRGLCSGFKTPPTLRQFCGRDEHRGSFVSRLLGGEFTDSQRRQPQGAT